MIFNLYEFESIIVFGFPLLILFIVFF